MVHLLQKKFEENKEAWYILSVTFGKEVDLKRKLMNHPDLDVLDVIAPEPFKDDKENDIYKYFLGYSFVKLFLNINKYSQILELESVYRFLGGVVSINKKNHVYIPYKIAEKEMSSVKDYLTGKKVLTNKNNFNVKDRVIIARGDLTSIKGKIIEITKNNAKILPDSFFQNVIVVPVTSLEHCA